MAVFETPKGFFESVSAVTATNTVDPGTRRIDNGKEYVYVYNNGTTQISIGEGATVSALSGYSVTVSSVSGESPLIGVAHNKTLTTSTYGWLVSKGTGVKLKCELTTALGAGENVVLGLNGAFARVTGATGYKANTAGYITAATATAGIAGGAVNAFII